MHGPMTQLSPEAFLAASGGDGDDSARLHRSRWGQRVAGELEASLTRHLMAGRNSADVAQVLLAAVTVFVFWDAVAAWMGLAWLGAFVFSATARAINRAKVVPDLQGPGALLGAIRRDVWISASLWGGWALLLIGATEIELAYLVIIFAGLVAAATSTLVADQPAFMGFMGLLIGPLFAALLLSGHTRDHLALVLMTVLFTPFMLVVHRRAHELLVNQIRAAARLRLSEEETARRRDFLNALISWAPTLIVVLDASGRIVRANPAFQKILGFDATESEGEKLVELVTPAEAGRLAEFLEGASSATATGELGLLRADGRPVTVQLSATEPRGMAPGTLILVGEDVTEQALAREATEEARVQAEEAARAKSSFLASMSHEIRTPLNGILGMVELLLDADLSASQREAAEIVRSSGQGLLRILNDVLDVSKIEAGQLDLEEIDFRPDPVVRDVGRVFAVPAAEKGVELLLDIDPDLPGGLRGDPGRIRQILTNLVGNAVKFTEEGEIVVSVRYRPLGDRRHELRVSVRDTGPGVPPDKIEEIFEEFGQADSSTTRTHGGTGLGLTICRRLVSLMGGQLEVESEVGEGSDFRFSLALEEATEEVESGARPSRRLRLQGLRLLVVDDNPTARRIVREALEPRGATVESAAGVDEGVAVLRAAHGEGRPMDAVFLDQMMPERDGFELVREIRGDDALDGVPIIMVTSAGETRGMELAKEAGMAGYLNKPVSPGELVDALDAVLGEGAAPGAKRSLVTRETLIRKRRPGVRILLAEDNPVNQQVAIALLKKRGYEVDAVPDGEQAVAAVQSGTYDAVLMDIQMPGMDGLEATRNIRALEGFENLPILALTAHAFAEERARCEAAGMNDFLAKPFKPEDLYDLVAQWTEAAGGVEMPSQTGERTMGAQDERTEPPVDLESFRAVMREAGVEEVVESTVAVYREEGPGMLEAVRGAAEAGDAEAMQKAAHSMKSASANIRATRLAELLKQMEEDAAGGDAAAAAARADAVAAEYEAVMRYLDEEAQEPGS